MSFVIDTYKEGINADDDDDDNDDNKFLDGLDDEPVPSPTARRPYVILQGEKLTSSPAVRGVQSTDLLLCCRVIPHAAVVVRRSFDDLQAVGEHL